MRILRFLATCLIFVCLATAAFAEKFTIAAIPDTQNYVDSGFAQPGSTNVFIGEMQFLADNKTSMNIVFTSHVGDVVQYGAAEEWDRALSALDVLHNAGMIFGITAGNHDGGFTNYCGPNSPYFAGKPWYGGANTDPFFEDRGASSWQTFTAAGRTFLHISTQYQAHDSYWHDRVLAWAQTVIDAHPGMPTVYTVHAYLGGPGLGGAPAILNKFVKVNPEIFLVLCGHGSISRRVTTNNYGKQTYEVMSDYQYYASGAGLGPGGGWVRLMEFDTDLNQIHFKTYSSVLNKYSTDPTLTDGSTYARTWAKFNYENNGAGALYPPTSPTVSDFTYSFNFNDRWNPPAPIKVTLTAQTDSYLVGPVAPTGATQVRKGALYVITAPTTFPFQGWTASPSTAATFSSASSAETTVILNGDCTVTANYPDLVALTMAASPAEKGTLTPFVGTAGAIKNQPLAISATAIPGYTFTGWTASPAGSASFADARYASTTLTPTGDCTVTANFEPSTPIALTMVASLPGGGVLTPSVGTHTVIRHEPQSISAAVNPDHAFTGWTASPSQNASFLNAGVLTTTVFLSGPCTITANFAETVRLNLAVSPAGGGTIQPSTSLTHTLFKGASMTLFVQSTAPGYRFLNWSANPPGNASFNNPLSTLATVTVTGHCTVTARFANYVLGDLSGDGIFNAQDVVAFKTALSDKAAWESATGHDADQLGDFNGDGVFNALDIPGFKAASGY